MTVKLLAEQHLEFLSLKEGFTGWSESTHIKILHCWKSSVTARMTNSSLVTIMVIDPFHSVEVSHAHWYTDLLWIFFCISMDCK